MFNHINVLASNEVLVTTAILINSDLEEAEMWLMGLEDELRADWNEIQSLLADSWSDDNTDITTSRVKVITTMYDNGVDLFIERNIIGREMVYAIE
jgi:hypothetical protein